PVKAEQRAQVPGIVHDVSSSGATVFLEPLETVEMGNRWREMLAEEQREVARILRELSSRVGARDADIAETIEALAEIDLSLAKARLGEEMGAKELPHDGHEQSWLREKPEALFLESATGGSLVLLDELGAGTDPVEGAALAKAILSHLLSIGCLTVATTHHGELKAFAHTTPGIANASVEFDVETLSPTYRLHIGLPGQSNALAIAQRLGMPEPILDEARAGIDPDRLAVESLSSDLHRERGAAETASAEQRTAALEAERGRQRVTKELQSLEANRTRLIEKTQREMETELAQMRSRLRDATRELQKAERLNVFERAQAVEAAKEEVAEAETSVKRVTTRTPRRRRAPLPQIAAGDQVFLIDVPTPGEAISPPDEQGDLDVKLGSLRARINVQQIERVEKGEGGNEDGRAAAPPASRLPMPTIPPELDLRGLTVDEALLLIDQHLDEAARAGVRELRIIHGKGTGTLRRAVREMLSKHALVQGHAAAQPRGGGDGVTVVELAG